jgi:hypothetical protein
MNAKTLVVTIGFLAASVSFAQMGPGPGGPGGPGGRGPGRGFGPFGPGPAGMHPGKVVSGAPYSADISNSVVQTLADGNTIQRGMTGHVARDAQGRTYSQETITGGMLAQKGPANFTFISDPVAGYAYILNSANKTAMRRQLKQPNGAGKGPARENDGQPHPERPNVTTADLGTQVVNGVSAQGKSITRTVPAGEQGNSQPIVSTSEIWISPELQVVVSSKRNDPFTGQATYALTNIQRTAPSPTLFQVPADYTIKDMPSGRGFGGRGDHGGPPPPLE